MQCLLYRGNICQVFRARSSDITGFGSVVGSALLDASVECVGYEGLG